MVLDPTEKPGAATQRPVGRFGPADRGPALRPEPTDGGAAETEGWWPPGEPAELPEPAAGFNSLRRWAGRLAFPMMALSIVLAGQGARLDEDQASTVPRWLWWTFAALAAVAGLTMVRLRHTGGGTTRR